MSKSDDPSPSGRVLLLIVGLVAIVAAGPTLIALLHAAVPLVIVGGIVAVVLRVVWHYTNRY